MKRTLQDKIGDGSASVVAQRHTLQLRLVFNSLPPLTPTRQVESLQERKHVVVYEHLLQRTVRQLEGLHVVEGGEAGATQQNQGL